MPQRKSRKPARVRPLALMYVRCSTAEQATTGATLAAQQAALATFAAAKGWVTELVSDPGISGKSIDRPGMNGAIQRLDAGDADILLAVRLDRLTRSNQDLLTLMDRSASNGWSMATTDGALDTSTAMGRAMAKMASVFAELERELIGERTKAGMAQRK